MVVLIPELIIYDNLIKLFNFINIDFISKSDEADTLLYHIFKTDINSANLTFNKTDYYQQAKAMFILRNSDSPRKLEVNMGFNMERSHFPTVHIMMPSESPGASPIGTNLGYSAGIGGDAEGDEYQVFTVGFSAAYSLLITSDNSLEVLLVYILLKSGFIGLKTQMELDGFQNVTFGGSDIMFNSDLMPQNIYSRNFNLNFGYDFSGRDIFALGSVNNITTNPTINTN